MFTGFFYLLRAHGFRVSLNEWMTLIEGLMLDLQHDSLTGFYELCRAVLVKSEADYDKFDQIFLEYFDGVPYQDELPKELMDWLNNPAAAMEEFRKFLRTQGYEEKSIEEILKMFEERLKEQTEEHNGGSYWIGTNGYSNFGNSGHSPQGIRVGGKSMYRRAFQVAGERRFRDFRKDNVLDIRQFQMAFRLLRQYSEQTQEAKTEFDVDGTIRETCDNAGTLSVCYKRPRKNTVKVLMLMDSGGSMEYYSNLCSMLFQAARQSNHFKELHVYYFHNCIYSSVYTDPLDPAEFRQRVQGHFSRRCADGHVRADGKALRLPHRRGEMVGPRSDQALLRALRPPDLAQSRGAPALGRLLGRELRLYRKGGGHVPADRRRSRARHEKAAREPVKE